MCTYMTDKNFVRPQEVYGVRQRTEVWRRVRPESPILNGGWRGRGTTGESEVWEIGVENLSRVHSGGGPSGGVRCDSVQCGRRRHVLRLELSVPVLYLVVRRWGCLTHEDLPYSGRSQGTQGSWTVFLDESFTDDFVSCVSGAIQFRVVRTTVSMTLDRTNVPQRLSIVLQQLWLSFVSWRTKCLPDPSFQKTQGVIVSYCLFVSLVVFLGT